MTDDSTGDQVRALYVERRRRFEDERAALARRARAISTARLATFLAAAAGAVIGFWGLRPSSPFALGGAAVAVVVFVALVLWHDRVLKRRDRAEVLALINDASLARMDRRWAALPRPSSPRLVEAANDPVAHDLDLFPGDRGRASVFQLLSTAHAPQGVDTLVAWLREAANVEEIGQRQEAVAELAPLVDLRQELELRSRQLVAGGTPPDPARFLEWAEGEPWLLRKPWLLWATRGLALVATGLALARLAGLAPTGWLLLALAVNLVVGFGLARRTHGTFDAVSGRSQAIRHYVGLLELLDRRSSFECARLRRLVERLTPLGQPASRHMRRLERLAGLADTRLTPLFHIPLLALTLWDFHVLAGFERWQRQVGREVRRWLATLGEAEALCALAALRHDNPGWVFPRVHESGEACLSAEGLGHPLLAPEAGVVNDVEVGPSGTFLLVTGSNMSGKSTLLRSIGTNVVLAQAGGPVCARRLDLPPILLATSFRVQDSLESGVSFFMAELRRLKQVVDLARECREGRSPRRLLYLLDEILQGTNVYERQVAVRRVIGHLLRYDAIGAISTHDLTLADAEGLAEACRAWHFTESYESGDEGPRMRFDYVLRPGVSSTVNALKLLEVVGLGDDPT
jgi:hypothetical protein